MGIDKPNIRYTIHLTIPISVEAFYQEAGRAGRDGFESFCIIIYSDDNYNEALDIINEDDHTTALARLQRIGWNAKGDILRQLWFIYNAYRDRESEKEEAYRFWFDRLYPSVNNMGSDATNSVNIPFGNSDEETSKIEKCIYRLCVLGVVEDYSKNWTSPYRMFIVKVKNIRPNTIKINLRRYIIKYKFDDYADEKMADIDTNSIESAVRSGIDVYVDFVYDEIVKKRKQALRTMGELARNFTDDESFRQAILAYLQESEFTPILRTWINQPYEQIGIESVEEVLNRVDTLEETRRLIGTCRRMLDEDPSNLSLRLLSVFVRSKSILESDESVLLETNTLIMQLAGEREQEEYFLTILTTLIERIRAERPIIEDKALKIILKKTGSNSFIGWYLSNIGIPPKESYNDMLTIILASSINIAKSMDFY